jgi:hypothetical protein
VRMEVASSGMKFRVVWELPAVVGKEHGCAATSLSFLVM